MQEQAFRDYLESREFDAADIQSQVEAVMAVEARLVEAAPAWPLEDLNRAAAQEMVDGMIDRGENTLENLLALVRYAKVIDNKNLYVTLLDLLDGCEVMDNLFSRLGEAVGEDLRDVIFEDQPLPPLGLSRHEKSNYTYRILSRMEEIFGLSTTRDLLMDSLRDLPDVHYAGDKRDFFEICGGDIDRYLDYRKQKLIENLLELQSRGELYFMQAVTDEVIDFVKSNPEIGGGVREGNLVYETKIPFDTQAYLAEMDPDKKRYHYCHCPWVKESLRKGTLIINPVFCQCSAGFTKRPFEVIFGRALQADVLESVLQGDPVCRFAIHLPD